MTPHAGCAVRGKHAVARGRRCGVVAAGAMAGLAADHREPWAVSAGVSQPGDVAGEAAWIVSPLGRVEGVDAVGMPAA